MCLSVCLWAYLQTSIVCKGTPVKDEENVIFSEQENKKPSSSV